MDRPYVPGAPCIICGAVTDFIALRERNTHYPLCSWSCVMVFGGKKDRDYRLYLVDLAEQRSTAIRTTLARLAAERRDGAESALDQLDEILHAIRAGA